MNKIVHIEIGGTDMDKAGAFYRALFGWKILDGPIRLIEGAGLTAHLNALGHEPSNYTIAYVGVDDIKSYIEKAVGLGAKSLVGPIAIPTGQFAWLLDPAGTMIGLWQDA